MNGIMGFAQLLNEPYLTHEEQSKFIRNIEKSSKRMLNILTALVNISKIESGQMEISLSDTDVNKNIEAVYNEFKQEAEKKGVQFFIRSNLPPESTIIQSDKEKILSVLNNLVDNAIKFTQRGSIEFGCSKKGEFLEFFVADTGDGIEEEKHPIIFERFRQGSESMTRNYEGAGLGLSIAKSYIEMLGGKIWFESHLKKGSTFYFTIPCKTETTIETYDQMIPVDLKSDSWKDNLKICN